MMGGVTSVRNGVVHRTGAREFARGVVYGLLAMLAILGATEALAASSARVKIYQTFPCEGDLRGQCESATVTTAEGATLVLTSPRLSLGADGVKWLTASVTMSSELKTHGTVAFIDDANNAYGSGAAVIDLSNLPKGSGVRLRVSADIAALRKSQAIFSATWQVTYLDEKLVESVQGILEELCPSVGGTGGDTGDTGGTDDDVQTVLERIGVTGSSRGQITFEVQDADLLTDADADAQTQAEIDRLKEKGELVSRDDFQKAIDDAIAKANETGGAAADDDDSAAPPVSDLEGGGGCSLARSRDHAPAESFARAAGLLTVVVPFCVGFIALRRRASRRGSERQER
jgi:hypothetical protein